MLKLILLLPFAALAACVVAGKDLPGPRLPTSPTVEAGLAGGARVAQLAAGCFAGTWKGGGETPGIDNHFGFTIKLEQDGDNLKGVFEFIYQMGREGTQTVAGTVDCDKGTAELRGTAVTGDSALASFKLQLLPEKPGDVETGLEGSWTCEKPCTSGVLKAYRRHP